MAYFGAAADLGAYLFSVGYPVAPNQNPAEFVLDIVNKDFTDASKVRLLTLAAEGPARELVKLGSHGQVQSCLIE